MSSRHSPKAIKKLAQSNLKGAAAPYHKQILWPLQGTPTQTLLEILKSSSAPASKLLCEEPFQSQVSLPRLLPRQLLLWDRSLDSVRKKITGWQSAEEDVLYIKILFKDLLQTYNPIFFFPVSEKSMNVQIFESQKLNCLIPDVFDFP